MIYLILAIIFSAGVFVAMRFFKRFGLDNNQALMWNYVFAAVTGLIMCRHIDTIPQLVVESWFGLSLLTGFWFIFTYLLMTASTQSSGVTITSLSSKLSVVLPTLAGVFLFHEKLNTVATIGIVLALVALFLVVGGDVKQSDNKAKNKWLLPVLIFFGTGIGDILMKLTEQRNTSDDMSFMIAFIYLIAMLFGIIIVVFDIVSGKAKMEGKNAVGGIALGVINFFSTYCVYHAMRFFDNVTLFPIYNIGVVSLTALVGWLLFKEKLTWKNYLGLAIAVVAVVLIAMKTWTFTTKHSHSVDFYYWKSKCAIGETERDYFSQLDSKRLFIRLFDVDVENGMAVPVGQIQSFDREQLPSGDVEVIPVVFITNRTFQHYVDDDDIDKIVSNVCSGIDYFMQISQVEYDEIQIDCDWTTSTRDAYFRFLKAIAEQSECRVSCTLRLHQIRDRQKTGVPPVDRGSLMCYATSSPMEGMTRNSILDMDLLKSYTANINDYPLPFDVILPIYSWGIVTNHLGKVKLINGLTDDDLQTPMFEKIDENKYLVKEDGFLQGMYINKGFTIKIETIGHELLADAKQYLEEHIENDFGWVYFHLSKGFLTRYTIEELK